MSNKNIQWHARRVRSPRIDCKGPSDFAVDGRAYSGMVKNRSDTGVLVESLDIFNVGQEVVLSYICPYEDRPIKRKGVIVRVTDTGFGVRYKF